MFKSGTAHFHFVTPSWVGLFFECSWGTIAQSRTAMMAYIDALVPGTLGVMENSPCKPV